MLTTIDSVKRAARKGKSPKLEGLNKKDMDMLLGAAGFPTSSGTIYIPGYDGKNRYLKYKKL